MAEVVSPAPPYSLMIESKTWTTERIKLEGHHQHRNVQEGSPPCDLSKKLTLFRDHRQNSIVADDEANSVEMKSISSLDKSRPHKFYAVRLSGTLAAPALFWSKKDFQQCTDTAAEEVNMEYNVSTTLSQALDYILQKDNRCQDESTSVKTRPNKKRRLVLERREEQKQAGQAAANPADKAFLCAVRVSDRLAGPALFWSRDDSSRFTNTMMVASRNNYEQVEYKVCATPEQAIDFILLQQNDTIGNDVQEGHVLPYHREATTGQADSKQGWESEGTGGVAKEKGDGDVNQESTPTTSAENEEDRSSSCSVVTCDSPVPDTSQHVTPSPSRTAVGTTRTAANKNNVSTGGTKKHDGSTDSQLRYGRPPKLRPNLVGFQVKAPLGRPKPTKTLPCSPGGDNFGSWIKTTQARFRNCQMKMMRQLDRSEERRRSRQTLRNNPVIHQLDKNDESGRSGPADITALCRETYKSCTFVLKPKTPTICEAAWENPRNLFPLLLYDMLQDANQYRFSHIIGWQPSGETFHIHKPDILVQSILPIYFPAGVSSDKQKSLIPLYDDFLELLSKWGFEGGSGVYFHPDFEIDQSRKKLWSLCKLGPSLSKEILDPSHEDGDNQTVMTSDTEDVSIQGKGHAQSRGRGSPLSPPSNLSYVDGEINFMITPMEWFPCMLFSLLEEAEKSGMAHIACWNRSGRVFGIYQPDLFQVRFLESFFGTLTFAEFLAQLRIWGFSKIEMDEEEEEETEGALYAQKGFRRSQTELCIELCKAHEGRNSVVDITSLPSKEEPSAKKQHKAGAEQGLMPAGTTENPDEPGPSLVSGRTPAEQPRSTASLPLNEFCLQFCQQYLESKATKGVAGIACCPKSEESSEDDADKSVV